MNVKLYGELIEDGLWLQGLSKNVDRLSSFAYNFYWDEGTSYAASISGNVTKYV